MEKIMDGTKPVEAYPAYIRNVMDRIYASQHEGDHEKFEGTETLDFGKFSVDITHDVDTDTYSLSNVVSRFPDVSNYSPDKRVQDTNNRLDERVAKFVIHENLSATYFSQLTRRMVSEAQTEFDEAQALLPEAERQENLPHEQVEEIFARSNDVKFPLDHLDVASVTDAIAELAKMHTNKVAREQIAKAEAEKAKRDGIATDSACMAL